MYSTKYGHVTVYKSQNKHIKSRQTDLSFTVYICEKYSLLLDYLNSKGNFGQMG